MGKKWLFLFACLYMMSMFAFAAGVLAQDDPNCPGAPLPRLVVGGQGRVTPGDPNNVRDAAARSGAKIGAIPGGEAFSVLEGPVCADGLNWWRVSYGDLTGWTVEGASGAYWVEPYDPNQPTATPLPPTETPLPTPTPAPAHVFEPLRPVVNTLASGVQARIISDEGEGEGLRLTVRAQPGVNGEVITHLTAGDRVTIRDGVQESDSLIWREIQMADGRQGWMVEGLWNNTQNTYNRTLLPACPVAANRIAFFIARYIYTANPDGSEACVMDKLLLPEVHTFYPYYVYLPNTMIWSPDHTTFAYVDFPDNSDRNQELFILSADGMERRQVTHNDEGGDVYWMDWSPDGQRLAIAQQVVVPGSSQIWTMRTDGSLYAALTTGNNPKLWAGWLADSTTLVYVENIGEARSQIGPTPQEFIFYTV
ncbi:MAG: SH3 domain-containing protein, partial [Anaerolineae bacterium]|nr:SH3 domain-containing protein [Anaerolineae bacterium]